MSLDIDNLKLSQLKFLIILENQLISIYFPHRNDIGLNLDSTKETNSLFGEHKMKMNHVGIMVGDMDQAVEFYTKALGLRIVMNNTKVIEERESAIGRMCIAVFGEGFNGFNIAHLVTSDGIGVELFEMKERQERHEVDFSRLGIFHFCLQLPKEQFASAIKRVEEFGGKVRMDIMRYHPEDDSKQAQMVYLEDPFGNLFEFYSHSYEDTYASDYE
ncbi:VOC domain-containing protein [Vibrio agarivorans]